MNWIIFIAGGTYDEDLNIDITRKHIMLLGMGSWNLGTFDASYWLPSGTARNINITTTKNNINGVRHQLYIGTILPKATAMTTHPAYFTCARISGRINITHTVATTLELCLQAQIYGLNQTESIIMSGSDCHIYWFDGRADKAITGLGIRIQSANNVRFSGLVNIRMYSLLRDCRFEAGMTVTSLPGDIIPYGMVNCYPIGVFTGIANSMVMDGTTNYWFKINGCTLAGGATKKIMEDLIP